MHQSTKYSAADYVSFFTNGDERGLAYFYEKLMPALAFYANRFINNHMLAEEIASTAFVKAWRMHEKLDSWAGIKAYLYKIVERDCIRAISREKKRKVVNQTLPIESLTNENSFTALVKAETYQILYNAIKELAPGTKTVMEALFIEGKTLTETAKELDLSVSTVNTQRTRGLAILRKIIPKTALRILVLLVGVIYSSANSL